MKVVSYKGTPLQTSGVPLEPPGGNFGFCSGCGIEGNASLQAVSECPLHG